MAFYSHGTDKYCTDSATSVPLCTLEVAPDVDMCDYQYSTVAGYQQQGFHSADKSQTCSRKSLFHSGNNNSPIDSNNNSSTVHKN